MSELVSTIIPTLNHENYLPFAIRSALDQTYQPHEVIVVDDGSNDSTEDVVRRFSSGKLRYIYQDHHGLPSARNAGIAAARGQYLTFLDADDLLFPQAIELLLRAAKSQQAAFVAGLAIVTDPGGRLAPGTLGAKPSFKPIDLLRRNPFHVGSVLVAKQWVERVGCFCQGLHACEDWDLWLRLAKHGCPMVSIQSAVSLYLNHEGQMSRNPYVMRDASLEVLDRIFSDRSKPRSWRDLKVEAFVNAHLRSAARFLRGQCDFEAREAIRAAARLRPSLMKRGDKQIIQTLSAWHSDPMIKSASDYRSSVVRAVHTVRKELPRDKGGNPIRVIRPRRSRVSLGIVVGDETWHFFKEIYDYLCRRYRVSVFRPIGGVGPQNASLIHDLREFLQQHQVAFFEWSSQLLALATQLQTDCRIVTRLHRYELFSWADKVDWTRVEATIFVSSAMLKKFKAVSRELPARTVVIPPGVSTRRFHPLRQRLNRRIGTLCWLTPRKRVYELIISFAGVCRSHPHLKLSIAGGPHSSFPDYYDTLVSLVKKLKLSSRVEFVHEPSNISKWYRTVDVFVSNGYSEGLQVALLEAMASGCYCLSHAWPGIEDVLPNDQIFLTDQGLQKQLLAYYAAPPAFRRQARDKMRRRASLVFDIEKVQRRVGSLVAEVAQTAEVAQ
jgi:glycosyltransferase involved in cell wall biosynthesis